jgi:hypothetical protein
MALTITMARVRRRLKAVRKDPGKGWNKELEGEMDGD